MTKMVAVVGMAVAVLVAGCAATQPQMPQQKSLESSDFLFRAKAVASQERLEATVEVKGTVEVIKEVDSGSARAQWGEEHKAVANLNKPALTDTTVTETAVKEKE